MMCGEGAHTNVPGSGSAHAVQQSGLEKALGGRPAAGEGRMVLEK